jgi:cell division septation protein DedD
MRDLDRWKDKVEISLDGRQIFFLFFGGAVVACILFVTGVLVGKRMEARALAMSPAPVEDPLAALDQLGDADEGLTYHRTLGARDGKRGATAAASAASGAASIATAATVATSTTAAAAAAAPSSEPALAVSIGSASERAESAAPTRPAPAQAVKRGEAPKVEAGARYTLQLSAFPDRADADAFMKKVQASGMKPFVVQSEVPGKGTFWRVRVGDFASKEAAQEAKNELERRQHLIAYVAKL